MFKNNCEIEQKFNFSDLIILQFFLSYVGLWSYTGHTEYSLFHFSKEKYKYTSGCRRDIEGCTRHSAILRAEGKTNSDIGRKENSEIRSFLSQVHC